MSFKIEKAKKNKHKLRLLLSGLSGSGKTYSALMIAKGMGLLGYGKTLVIDTENRSSALYGDRFEFDIIGFDPPHSPERYVEAIEYAEKMGYELIIVDSVSHEWSYASEAVSLMSGKNGIKNWGDHKSKRRQKFIDKILRPKTHLICTSRVKSAYDEVEDKNGQRRLTKVGTQIKQEDGLEFEYDVVMELTRNHYYTCSKTRAIELEKTDPVLLTEEVGQSLMKWLEIGEISEDGMETASAPLSEYASIIKDKINLADEKTIMAIGDRLQSKEVRDKLSSADKTSLDGLYQMKLDQINKEF